MRNQEETVRYIICASGTKEQIHMNPRYCRPVLLWTVWPTLEWCNAEGVGQLYEGGGQDADPSLLPVHLTGHREGYREMIKGRLCQSLNIVFQGPSLIHVGRNQSTRTNLYDKFNLTYRTWSTLVLFLALRRLKIILKVDFFNLKGW